ncbi:hypothetical protein C7999DRAFT_38888 [Corynascus novoguineensis]|uniref:HNH domain-containing protein n=1 Tax=Corynascus novoguineensis TaxID=1126955 RepID=A0AAN7HS65_9PEZI|nr:hypothetical protein C7999DRAFT_38888 [Corynascus novoguineensis]
MSDEVPEEYTANYEQFRDTLSSFLIERIAAPSSKHKPKSKRRSRRAPKIDESSSPAEPGTGPNDDTATEPSADDLADFTSYIAATTFLSLPDDLRSLTHHAWADSPALRGAYALPLTPERAADLVQTLDPSVPDSLTAYGITAPPSDGPPSNLPVTTPPPPPASTKAQAEGCEICGRDWINLTYHHLIPRMVHDKVVRRGWHREDELQNVAWLCGACHRFVHRFRSHEELAREYYTVERLLAADEVRRFADWVGRVRW